MNILLIEDDKTLSCYLKDMLVKSGYQVEQCFDGERGLMCAREHRHHLILLDKMLPKLDGVTLLKSLREFSQVPVIMVSAQGAEEERIIGLSHGADDYVAKPFNAKELLLRVESLLRRSQANSFTNVESEISIDGLTINASSQQIQVDGKPLEFTPIQFKLLWQLISKPNIVIDKSELYQSVLNRQLGAYDRSLDMHLSRVRRKLSQANWQGERLQTVHGKGYCFK
ncbi:response regulator transcription factor [Pseudoalteromonas sp. XMcav1-K]|uniref:response regulator transcription factor n=1 Tax=Pseudoalteromonas sp. XMcav1-K TaxID=3374372 RepID=UPI0037575366